MLSVNISFTGLANVLIAGMASISNRFNTAYYTTYRRVSGERNALGAANLPRTSADDFVEKRCVLRVSGYNGIKPQPALFVEPM